MDKSFGAHLRSLRALPNYTEEHVANVLGIGASTYSRVENDERELKPSELEKLARLYGIDYDELSHIAHSLYKEPKPKPRKKKKKGISVHL